MVTAGFLPPYRIPGTFPVRRRRRLAPLPCPLRVCATTSIAMLLSYVKARFATGSRRQKTPRAVAVTSDSPNSGEHEGKFPLVSLNLFHEQRAHRILVADAENRLREQSRDRQRADLLARLGGLGERDGVGHHQLVHL